MARLFGTDGVRGIANVELTCEMAYRLGQAAAIYLGKTIVVGRDTRRSGDMLGAALSAGIMSAGGTVLEAGIIPTPGVALLVREMRAAGGAVISASHNPPEYNGIKFFDAQGFKLPDAVEDEIEAFIVNGGLEGEVAAAEEAAWSAAQAAAPDAPADATSYLASEIKMPAGAEVGVVIPLENACDIYIDHAARSIEDQGISFKGLRIALDTGHGASSLTSPEALRRLGAEVIVINDDFDGMDINVQCGSTHLEPLRALMVETGADVGIAHDGDADRVMLMAPDGTEIDGDMVEAVCAPLFVITTDGMENASRHYSSDRVKQMIERQKSRYGWEFLFLGANIDAVETAGHFGIDADRAVNYHSDSEGTALNYEVLSETICAVRCSQLLGSDWKKRIDEDYRRRK